MGKAAVPLAVVGGSLLLPFAAPAIGGLVSSGVAAGGLSSAVGGLTSAAGSMFSASGLAVAASGVGAFSSIMSARSQQKAAGFEMEQIAEQKRLSRAQAAQQSADASDRLKRIRGSAKAKAAAGGTNVNSSRSFLAFLTEQDRVFGEEISNIRVNAQSKQNIFNSESRAAQSTGGSAMTRGLLKAGTQGLQGYSNYEATKGT